MVCCRVNVNVTIKIYKFISSISPARRLQLHLCWLGISSVISVLYSRCYILDSCWRTDRQSYQLLGGTRCRSQRLPRHRLQFGSACSWQSRCHRQRCPPTDHWYCILIIYFDSNLVNAMRRRNNLTYYYLIITDRSWPSLPTIFYGKHWPTTWHNWCWVCRCDSYTQRTPHY